MRRRAVVVALGAVLAVAGCSGEDSPPIIGSPSTATDAATANSIPTEPTGVPGLDDPSPFCALWAGYAGTVQVLSVAAAFGELDSLGLTELEVVAAPDLVTRIAALEAQWPDAIAAEREVVLTGPMGGWYERSGSVTDLLQRSVDVADLAALGAAWVDVLAARDPEAAVPDLGLDDERRELVDELAPIVLAEVGPLTDDPRLRRPAVDAPATRAYLASNCPDLAASGVNDAL